MLKLSERYAERPATEFPMLFQRILQNTIRDHFRRQKVRSLWTSLMSSLSPKDADEDHDPLETFQSESDSKSFEDPHNQLARAEELRIIEKALESLPARQRQAFILRYWEDMDVAETAQVMGCSDGSVKTHCSRATHTLAGILQAKGIKL